MDSYWLWFVLEERGKREGEGRVVVKMEDGGRGREEAFAGREGGREMGVEFKR